MAQLDFTRSLLADLGQTDYLQKVASDDDDDGRSCLHAIVFDAEPKNGLQGRCAVSHASGA
jgi:hypothetical protein